MVMGMGLEMGLEMGMGMGKLTGYEGTRWGRDGDGDADAEGKGKGGSFSTFIYFPPDDGRGYDTFFSSFIHSQEFTWSVTVQESVIHQTVSSLYGVLLLLGSRRVPHDQAFLRSPSTSLIFSSAPLPFPPPMSSVHLPGTSPSQFLGPAKTPRRPMPGKVSASAVRTAPLPLSLPRLSTLVPGNYGVAVAHGTMVHGELPS